MPSKAEKETEEIIKGMTEEQLRIAVREFVKDVTSYEQEYCSKHNPEDDEAEHGLARLKGILNPSKDMPVGEIKRKWKCIKDGYEIDEGNKCPRCLKYETKPCIFKDCGKPVRVGYRCGDCRQMRTSARKLVQR